MTQADADAVFAAGWDEHALHDAIAITARAAFMQRPGCLGAGEGLKGRASRAGKPVSALDPLAQPRRSGSHAVSRRRPASSQGVISTLLQGVSF